MKILFQRSQINAEMEEELRSHIQHRADDLELRAYPVPRRNAAPASSSVGRKSTRRNATKRWAAPSPTSLGRMCATAFACCASLRDSPSPPC